VAPESRSTWSTSAGVRRPFTGTLTEPVRASAVESAIASGTLPSV
jgi:hypothetical protein